MRTRAELRIAMKASEDREERVYRELTQTLFARLNAPLEQLYDATVRATANLTAITADVLRQTPAVVKILRYCTTPAISQMRLGQLVGLRSTDSFEEKRSVPDLAHAEALAAWFRAHLDAARFPWAVGPVDWSAAERSVAERYAKLWTVSLVSNQNTATKYRNERKALQERAITTVFAEVGLLPQRVLQPPPTASFRPRGGGIHFPSDLAPSSFVAEQKIVGRSEKRQKADVTVRPTDSERLFCIEAKAVGIRIDSTKRLKELNDKYTDWTKSGLPITTVGVVAGFFNEIELVATIKGRGIPIFFEHELGPLTDYLMNGRYFGEAWNPAVLFPDVPITEVEAGVAKIAAAADVPHEVLPGD